MSRKLVPLMIITLILSTPLVMGVKARSVEADQTFCIKANGGADGPLSSNDNVTYSPIEGTNSLRGRLVIDKDNIIVDGNGDLIEGTEGRGVTISGRYNVTIKNWKIKGFHWGIWVENSSEITISGNSIRGTYAYARYDGGIGLSTYSNHTTVFGNNITMSYYGIDVSFSSYNNFSKNNITDHHYGIMLYRSLNNSISRNRINGLSAGLFLLDSYNNTISENDVGGVSLKGANENYIFGNTITHKASEGIELEGFHNVIYRNTITDNYYVIYLKGDANTIFANNITQNYCGIFVGTTSFLSSGNVFYHNNLIDNSVQVYVKYQRTDIWDN